MKIVKIKIRVATFDIQLFDIQLPTSIANQAQLR